MPLRAHRARQAYSQVRVQRVRLARLRLGIDDVAVAVALLQRVRAAQAAQRAVRHDADARAQRLRLVLRSAAEQQRRMPVRVSRMFALRRQTQLHVPWRAW